MSETRARVKITPRVSPFLAWGDFHAPLRFARSTIPEEKWGTTRSLTRYGLQRCSGSGGWGGWGRNLKVVFMREYCIAG